MINKTWSYILGLLQTDGHHRQKGNYHDVEIEISIKDRDIIHRLGEIILEGRISTRNRKTNFSKNKKYKCIMLRVNGKYLPRAVISNIPAGKKSNVIRPPSEGEYSQIDYWRGVIDGDGSIGFRTHSNNKIVPFISLTTASENLYLSFRKFLKQHIGIEVNCSRNNRDDIYNIVLAGEHCKRICNILYYNGSISIKRKYIISQKIIKWNKEINPLFWTKQEDLILLKNGKYKARKLLNRSINGINSRWYFLHKK